MQKDFNGIILTAAKADITICGVFGNLPTGLIPVNGKPIIFYILQQYFDNEIKDVYISVDYKKNQLKDIVKLYFQDKLNLHFIECDKSMGAGDSLLEVLSYTKSTNTVITLGDTFIKDLDFHNLSDALIISDNFLEEEKWATVTLDKNNNIINFNEKKIIQSNNSIFALCGVYIFSHSDLFKNFKKDTKKNIEISNLLEFYNKQINLKTIQNKQWLDFGHIDKYYVSKKKLIQSRGFNSLSYDDLLGTITKYSLNKEKFCDEIRWQISLPKSLIVLTPRVLHYSVGTKPFITMEYYSYPTLSEIWLFSELNEKIYYSILEKLFKILSLFLKIKQPVSLDEYYAIYKHKTLERINMIKEKSILNFFRYDSVTINGTSYNNWNLIQDKIFNTIEKLYNPEHNCLIHGDFCLSNILYDLQNGIVRLIDPRGKWGESEYGDIKYDIAKLRHSICGKYDYIVSDLFECNHNKNNLNYSIFSSKKEKAQNYFDKIISQYYDLNHIKLIEGLLFLSMIPLHSDHPSRQIVMYAKSIELLNQSII